MTSLSTYNTPFASFGENAQREDRSHHFRASHEASPIEKIFHERAERDPSRAQYYDGPAVAPSPTVEILPANSVRRRARSGHGMVAEYVQCIGQGVVKFRFRAPMHLLVAYEQGECREGETFVEGLPQSALRNFACKLTFVPAGHEYRACYAPKTRPNVVFFYIDPTNLGNLSRLESTDTSFPPRLFFENAALWPPILKLKGVVEDSASDDQSYFEALGTVLFLELARLSRGKRSVETPARGGLAAWQQRTVTAYIEQHFTESIPLATLAELVRLSPYHFCRSFKQSFGKPPHRYQLDRRIERAKMLLAKQVVSVTDVALAVGFDSSSSFATAFRKATGTTPTAYHRK